MRVRVATTVSMAAGVMALLAGPVAAQSAGERGYVAGAVFLDAHRVSGPDDDVSILYGGGVGSGETVGGAVRAGLALGERWGVEAEVAMPATLEEDLRYDILLPYLTSLGNGSSVFLGQTSLPLTQRIERQAITTSALLWFRRPMGDRVSLMVLGGVGFTRLKEGRALVLPFANSLPALVAPARIVSYDVGPVVGVEVPVRLTDRLDVVGGVRLHAFDTDVSSGWLVRPSAGVRWRF
jgi:opacity protein-like surface antigen